MKDFLLDKLPEVITIVVLAIYFGGIFYFYENGATFEQCLFWPLPFLFIGSFILPFIKHLFD